MPLSKDLREFVALLNSNGVEYLVVGALGIGVDDLQSPDRVIQLGVSPNRIDLLTGISGVTFEEAWATRTEGNLDGIAAPFIGREALIRNKQSTGRAKDLGDAEELRKRPGGMR